MEVEGRMRSERAESMREGARGCDLWFGESVKGTHTHSIHNSTYSSLTLNTSPAAPPLALEARPPQSAFAASTAPPAASCSAAAVPH